MKSRRLLLLGVTALLTAACGAAGVYLSPNPNVDPTGDAGPSPTFDITETRSVRTGTTIEFSITTTPDPVLPPPGFGPGSTQMGFIIGFNTDLNTGTGIGMGGVCGLGQGLDFAVNGFARNSDGTYGIVDSMFAPTGSAGVSQSGSTITLSVPFLALGGDDGNTYSVTLVGIDSVDRDCSPNAGPMPTRPGEKSFYPTLR